jgi:ABC-type sugar transport system substrate-binding protein
MFASRRTLTAVALVALAAAACKSKPAPTPAPTPIEVPPIVVTPKVNQDSIDAARRADRPDDLLRLR